MKEELLHAIKSIDNAIFYLNESSPASFIKDVQDLINSKQDKVAIESAIEHLKKYL